MRLRFWSGEIDSAVPSHVIPLILHTQAESSAYSRASLLLPAFYDGVHVIVNRHFIGSRNGIPMAFTAESPPAHGYMAYTRTRAQQRDALTINGEGLGIAPASSYEYAVLMEND